ncbi:Multimodular transpeptidase-transglycosylase [hydrothermal vent metagenome]|uniref:peptidoglycan glycosyltransferase n=1 Tax=hydrothermal vent metagenome TaxID=652676 RepID=A0A3B1B0Q5_9ZZZZ
MDPRRQKRRVIFLLLFGLLLLLGSSFWFCLPSPLFQEPYSSILLSRDEQLLGAKIASDEQWRFPPLTVQQLATKFTTALIQFEDKRFDSHWGVDPLAILRALYLNISQNKIVSGGSTLSMQVIRLARKNKRRSYAEKMLEMIMALRLEMSYSKQEILALYASHAPFGGNVVGLETAAWRYFGRAAVNLSWAEACTLAVLPNSPALIHPARNRRQLKRKRDLLLQQLVNEKLISKTTLALALAENLPAKPLPLPNIASHLLASQIQHANPQLKTTIDKTLQIAVQDIVFQHSKRLSQREIYNAAALVINNDTFEVLAYIGNSNTTADFELGYAIDLIRRPRSTGSILKPLLYAGMLQQGDILPETLVADLPTQYAGYTPENYDRQYRGAVPAKVALARSLNIPAVRMLKQYSVAKFYDVLKKMGMSTLHRTPNNYGLTLILGGAEGNLWDIANMYANLADIAKANNAANDATYKQLKVMRDHSSLTQQTREIQPAAAWLTMKALLEVSRPGDEGYWKNFNSSQKIAWKTGTSYGLRDAWAVGNTGLYTVAVWVGNASGEGKPGLTGVSAAAPIMFDIFNRLDNSAWFTAPYFLMKEVSVCKNDGYLANQFCDSKKQWIPKNSHFNKTSQNHLKVHLDTNGWRVNGQCEAVSNMQHKNWFVLPAGQEYYYKKLNANYRNIPDYRKDCIAQVTQNNSQNPIEILYPTPGTKLFIPIYLDETQGSTVFKAVHRNHSETLYWHLDKQFLGLTTTFHQRELKIKPGIHFLTLVDEQGNSLTRKLEVLGKKNISINAL